MKKTYKVDADKYKKYLESEINGFNKIDLDEEITKLEHKLDKLKNQEIDLNKKISTNLEQKPKIVVDIKGEN